MNPEPDLDERARRLTGEVLANRYQIENKIGEGAMGAVYRAKHVKVGRAFAVKVLHSRLLIDHKVLQRFEREAELAGRLRHPNVIGVVDVGETTDGLRYMVMDFAAGPDLATLLNDAPFPPERIITITRQLLEGLYHAHEAGLIHRDFKPENVIVEKDTHGNDVPRIVDFGIAILREGGDSTDGPGRLTTNGLVLGTPHYMAPEQAVADPIDHRIDLFALGIIIYEMLCGKLPFDGTGAEVARANLLLDPPAISERVPYLAVDPLLEAFARRLMAKKRDQRPATAKAARELLDLVERDRDAAARELRVPVELARAPATTQPSAPIRHHSGNETFPPPLRGPQAPPMAAPTAVAATTRDVHVTTEQNEPSKRRAPLIAAAIAGVGVLGGAAFILMSGGDKPAAKQVATVETPTPAPAPTAAETQPAPAPAEPTPSETQTPETKAPEVTSVPPTAEAPESAKPKQKVITSTKGTTAKTSPTVTKAETKAVTKTEAKIDTKPAEKPTSTKIEPKPAVAIKQTESKPGDPPKAVSSQMLASQYQAVGNQLKQLQDAKGADVASDLWARYRMIRLVDAMSTQPKRDEAAATLSSITTQVNARKR